MKITILGAGPAGCAAAYFLRRRGFKDITIYEKEKIGGCAFTNFYNKIPYEFGPQVMFTDKEYLKLVFEQFLYCHPPPNAKKKYEYSVSIDGTIDDCHRFPVTMMNAFKFRNPIKVLCEMAGACCARPDYSNFENYCISRLGKTFYETYVRNYNRKAWQMDPKDMDTDWVHFRPLKLQLTSSRFGKQWQGHPGNYNPMWATMTEGVKLETGDVHVNGDLEYCINGSRLKTDLMITTISMSQDLEFVNTCLVYVALKSDTVVMPCAFTTFPNTYDFTRIFEYRQQFYVDSQCTLLSFDFPWKGEYKKDRYIEQALWFSKHMLKKEVAEHWIDNRTKIYPLSTRKNLNLFNELLKKTARGNIIPIGRAGSHAYVSKDTCIRMGMEVADHLDELTDPDKKVTRLLEIRKDLH